MSYRANGETGNKLATTLKTIVTVVATAGSNNNSLKSFKKYSFYKVFLLKYRFYKVFLLILMQILSVLFYPGSAEADVW